MAIKPANLTFAEAASLPLVSLTAWQTLIEIGHLGANHPVIDRRTGLVEVTAQNHGFVVDPGSLAEAGFELTHVSANDRTLEGMVHRTLPVFSCQYHPEASPGPHDARPWFAAFRERVMERRKARRKVKATAPVAPGVH